MIIQNKIEHNKGKNCRRTTLKMAKVTLITAMAPAAAAKRKHQTSLFIKTLLN